MPSYTEKLIELLKKPDYVPLPIEKLIEILSVPEEEIFTLKFELKGLLSNGIIAQLKQGRLCIPKDASLITGKIRFKQNGAGILIPQTEAGTKTAEPIQIHAEDTGLSLHNDLVLARMVQTNVPHFKKKYKKGKKPKQKTELRNKEPRAKVIRVLEKARESLTGTLKKSRHAWYVIPSDPRIVHDIIVEKPSNSQLSPKPQENDKVLVKLSEWTSRHLNPEGEITEIFGETHTPLAEYKAILHQYDLDPNFSAEVMDETAAFPEKVPSSAAEGRIDLRDKDVFTIDPDDAKDFDDALSIEEFEDGRTEVGVHIADVSSYVKPGTELDKEAHKRGNSTYLVGTVIPMLPHALSNGLCSLVEAEDRLTKSVFLQFTKTGRLLEKNTRFANTIIRSKKRLTYKQAYALLRQRSLDRIRELPLPPAHQTGSTGRAFHKLSDQELLSLQNHIRNLWKIATKLRKKRFSHGSLDLNMPESKILIDEEGYAEKIEKIENDESHQLIEEFMLAANESVARTLLLSGLPLIHRTHDKPDPEKLNELREHMDTAGIRCGDLNNRKELSKLLEEIHKHEQGHVLRIQVLRSLKQACYKAEPDGHFGLNKQFYSHFTSPIRRYSDLIVHRIFDSYLERNQLESAQSATTQYKKGALTNIAQHLSITEQNSTDAERESIKIKTIEYFERETKCSPKDKTVFDCVVVELRTHGMFIELTESLAFGMIHVSSLRDDLYNLNANGSQLVGRRRKRSFQLGQKLQVVVKKVDKFKRQVDFSIA